MVGYSSGRSEDEDADAEGVAALVLLQLFLFSSDESCEFVGDDVSAAAAAVFLSDLPVLGLVLVVLEAAAPAAREVEELVVVLVLLVLPAEVFGLGLKPGKALPWTSWPARKTGGSLAQYEALGSGGGRELRPIRGCLRRGSEQFGQTEMSAGLVLPLSALTVVFELGLEVFDSFGTEFESFLRVCSLSCESFGFSGSVLASFCEPIAGAASPVGPPFRML
jgi:hypothetical protein